MSQENNGKRKLEDKTNPIKETECLQDYNKKQKCEDETPKLDINIQIVKQATDNEANQNMSCTPESSLAGSSGIGSQENVLTYQKRLNRNRSDGFNYQAMFCLWYALRANEQFHNGNCDKFQICSEITTAGIFDDAVITLFQNNNLKHIMIQFKSKVDGSMLKNCELFPSENNKNRPYTIQKYYLSFLNELNRTQFSCDQILHLVLATNRNIAEDVKVNFKKIDKNELNPLLELGDYYQFKDLNALRTYLKLDNINEIELELFYSKFVLAVKQPTLEELENLFLNKYIGLKENIFKDMYNVIQNWMNESIGLVINKKFLEDNILKTKKTRKKIEKYRIKNNSSENISENFLNEINDILYKSNDQSKTFFFSVDEKEIYLNTIKSLNNSDILYLNNFDTIDESHEICWLSRHKILVIDNDKTLRYKEKVLLQTTCHKIIILLERYELMDRKYIKNSIHLSKKFTGSENIGVYKNEIHYSEDVNSDLKLLVVNDGEFNVVQKFKGKLEFLYKNFGNEIKYVTKKMCHKCKFKSKNSKVRILSSDPGTGKTTQLKIIQNKFRSNEKFKNYEILFFNPDIFKRVTIQEIQIEIKTIIFFDAFDETEENYRPYVLTFLTDIVRNPKTKKIFITTRRNCEIQLMNLFETFSYRLPLLSPKHQNMILTNYISDCTLIDKIRKKQNVIVLKSVYDNPMFFKLFISLVIEDNKFFDDQNFVSIGFVFDKILEKSITLYLINKLDLHSEHPTYMIMKKGVMKDLQNVASQKLIGGIQNINFIVLDGTNRFYNLIELDAQGRYNFKHKLYAEYFLARNLLTNGLDNLDNELFEQIFCCEDNIRISNNKWSIVRHFLDYLLQKKDTIINVNLRKNIESRFLIEKQYLEDFENWWSFKNVFLLVFDSLNDKQKNLWLKNNEWNELMIESLRGDSVNVKTKLDSNNYKIRFRLKSLLIACYIGNVKIIEMLCDDQYIDMYDNDFFGYILHYTFHLNKIKIFRFLVNKAVNYGTKIIAVSVDTDNISHDFQYDPFSGYLLSPLQNGQSILDEAIAYKNEKICNYLLEQKIQISKFTVNCALSYKRDDILRQIFDKRIDQGIENNSIMSLLHAAIERPDTKFVSEVISSGRYNLDKQNGYGYTPLVVALKSNKDAVAKQLIKMGADVELETKKSISPFALACHLGKTSIVEFILMQEIYVNVNVQTKEGATPLILASMNNHIDIVQTLIRHNCKIDMEDDLGYTALMRAAQFGYTTIVEFLLAKKANVLHQNLYGHTALSLSMINNHPDTTEILADAMKKENYNMVDTFLPKIFNNGYFICYNGFLKTTPLEESINMNNVELVKKQIQKDINIIHIFNFNNETPFSIAASNGYQEILTYMTHNTFNLNFDNKSCLKALRCAHYHDKPECFVYLLNIIFNFSTKSRKNYCYYYVKDNFRSLIQTNVANVINFKFENYNFLTKASHTGDEDIVKFLVSREPVVDFYDTFESIFFTKNKIFYRYYLESGQSGLAVTYYDNDMIEEFDIKYQDEFENSALMIATMMGRPETVKKLIDAGADVNYRSDEYGVTALILASLLGKYDLVELLVKNNANISCTTNVDTILKLDCTDDGFEILFGNKRDGCSNLNSSFKGCESAICFAAQNGNTQIVDFLKLQRNSKKAKS